MNGKCRSSSIVTTESGREKVNTAWNIPSEREIGYTHSSIATTAWLLPPTLPVTQFIVWAFSRIFNTIYFIVSADVFIEPAAQSSPPSPRGMPSWWSLRQFATTQCLYILVWRPQPSPAPPDSSTSAGCCCCCTRHARPIPASTQRRTWSCCRCRCAFRRRSLRAHLRGGQYQGRSQEGQGGQSICQSWLFVGPVHDQLLF